MTCDEHVRAVAVLAACGLALGSAAPARAQSAEAEVLFRDGRKLIQAGKLAEGCDKIEASERLESSVGALLNLGDCRERLGELASAWAAFRKAESVARSAGNDEKRRAEARRRAALVEPKLLYLVLEVERPVAGLVVRRDAESIDPQLWSTPVPVDPGTYDISAAAPGYRPWQTRVTIDARLRRRAVAIPALEPAPPPVVPAQVPPPAAAEVRASISRPAGTWSTPRKVSAVSAAAAAGALGTGVYFGWRAQRLAERADRRCPMVMCGDPEGLALNARARTAATTANVLYAAGGAAAVTAALLWLAGKPGDVAIRPGVAGGVGVSIAGRF